MLLLLFFIFSKVTCLKLVEYRFGENYGQRFFDFSYNNRDAFSEGSGAISTDRGIYLDGGQNRIKITPFYFKSTSTIILWMMAKADSGVIFAHSYSKSKAFAFYRDGTSAVLKRLGRDVRYIKSQGNVLNDQCWTLIRLLLKGDKYWIDMIFSGSSLHLDISLSVNIRSISSISLGAYNSRNPGLKIFFWFFAINTNEITLGQYYSSTGNCLSGVCSTCDYYFNDTSYSYICLSKNNDQHKDSNSNACPSSIGCSPNLTFLCNCSDYCFYNYTSTLGSCSTGPSLIITCSNSSQILRGSQCCNKMCSLCDEGFPDDCLSCIDPNAAPLNETILSPASNPPCLCADGFWGIASSSNTSSCYDCPLGCSACENDTFCTECIDGNSSLVNNFCQCNPGYFNEFPGINVTCSPCQEGCKQCKNSISCDLCYEDLTIANNDCSCKVGTFLQSHNSTFYNCLKCSNDCFDCQNLTFCIRCKDPFSKSENGKCVCIDLFVGLADQKVPCRAVCGIACSACTTSTECTSCIDPNANVVNKKCVCNTGFYLDSSDKITCLQCGFGCFQCSRFGLCEKCFDSNAETSQYVCKCKDGFYEILKDSRLSSEMKCAKCHYSCLTCSDFHYCITCSEEFEESVNGTCHCRPQFFNDSSVHVCKSCHVDCKSCENPFKCLECNSLNALGHQNEGCFCQNGFFNETRLTKADSCKQCEFRCKICKSYSNCLSCHGLNTRIVDGVCECMPGYYFNQTNSVECSPCITFTEDESCRLDCGKGKAWNNLQCVPCLEFCLDCDDSLACFECIEGMKISNGKCVCLKAQKLENNKCITQYFSLSVTILGNNSIDLTSEQDLESDITSENVKLYIWGESRDISITKLNEIHYQIDLQNAIYFNISAPYTLSLTSPMYSKEDSVLQQYDYFGEFPASPATPFGKAVKAAMKGVLSSSFTGAMVSNPASCWVLLNTIQLIIYLPLSPIKYSAKILEFIQSLAGYSIIPNIMEFLFDTKTSSKPVDRVQRVGLGSTVFWINIGPSLIILLFYLAIFPFVLIGSKLPFLSGSLSGLLKNYRYNIFLRFWIEVYLEAGLFSLIQIQSVRKTQTIHSKDIGYFNFMIATLTFGLVLATPLYAAYLFYSFRNKTSDPDVHERYGSIYCEFKLDKGFYSQLFYFVYIIRRLQFILTQCLLDDQVYWQFSLNLIFAIFQFVFIVYYKPFKEAHVMISEFVGELCVIFTIVISGFMLPSAQSFPQDVIDKVFFAVVLTCISLQTALSMFSLYLTAKEVYLKWKKYQLEKVIKKSQKVFPEKTNTTFADLTDQTNQ